MHKVHGPTHGSHALPALTARRCLEWNRATGSWSSCRTSRQKLLAAWSTGRQATVTPSSGEYLRVSDFLVARQVLESVSWLDAVEHAETLQVGGYSGWQLPIVDQLWAIVDLEEEPFEETRYHTREQCGSKEAYHMNIGSGRLNVAPKTHSRAMSAVFVREIPEETASP